MGSAPVCLEVLFLSCLATSMAIRVSKTDAQGVNVAKVLSASRVQFGSSTFVRPSRLDTRIPRVLHFFVAWSIGTGRIDHAWFQISCLQALISRADDWASKIFHQALSLWSPTTSVISP